MQSAAQASLFPEPAGVPALPVAITQHELTAPPRLLIQWEPWRRVILRNLADAFRRKPAPLRLSSRPAPFWPDVFVSRRVSGRPYFISATYHAGAVAFFYLLPVLMLLTSPPPIAQPSASRTITYYKLSEYLPEIHSALAPAKVARKGEPKFAPQPIVVTPERPDNRQETIVDPNSVKLLPHPVALPNLAVMTPILAAVPVAALERSPSKLTFPVLATPVIAPAPDSAPRNISRVKLPDVPAPSVIQPPPVPDDVPRKPGEINLVQAEVEEPKLPEPEQRASGGTETPASALAAKSETAAIPPPPVITGGISSKTVGQLLALNLSPQVVQGPIDVPAGNLRGEFAATPEGKPKAAGTADVPASETRSASSGSGSAARAGFNPAGINVGAGAGSTSAIPSGGVVAQAPAQLDDPGSRASPRLLASLTPPRIMEMTKPPAAVASEQLEDRVFGGKKYYSLTLNMPNLTSAGGSWVIRFAELGEEPLPGELTAPVAVEKVDPAYPPDLIRNGVEGVVMLYAVIHSDGTVGDVRILRGIQDRLDQNARRALEQWRFHPARKNGAPVDLEAVVRIPFKARRLPF